MTPKTRLLTFITGLGFALPACAIVNIENLRMDETKAGFSMSTTLSANGKRGNTEEDKYRLAGGMQLISDDLIKRNLFLFSADNAQSKGTTFSEAYFAHLRHTHQLNQTWFWEAFIQHQSEPLNNNTQRNLVGANARAKLSTWLLNGHGGAGIMYEQRSIEPSLDKIEETMARLNFYLDSKYKLTDTADWKISLYVQPKADDFDDVRSVAAAGLTTRINQTFAFTFDLSYSHESRPLVGQKQDDWSYTTGLNMRF